MTDEVTLLPCPFCGGDGGPSIGQHADGTAWHYVECDDCGASAESAEAWNRRSHLRTPRVGAGDGVSDDEIRVLLRYFRREVDLHGTAIDKSALAAVQELKRLRSHQ